MKPTKKTTAFRALSALSTAEALALLRLYIGDALREGAFESEDEAVPFVVASRLQRVRPKTRAALLRAARLAHAEIHTREVNGERWTTVDAASRTTEKIGRLLRIVRDWEEPWRSAQLALVISAVFPRLPRALKVGEDETRLAGEVERATKTIFVSSASVLAGGRTSPNMSECTKIVRAALRVVGMTKSEVDAALNFVSKRQSTRRESVKVSRARKNRRTS